MPISKSFTCSAVVLNYNHGHYIQEVLQPLIHQTIPFDEIIIVDDASTDDSVECIERIIADIPSARLVVNPANMGVNASANAILRALTCDFVYFCAADDWYSMRVLEHAQAVIASHPDVAMVSGNSRTRMNATGQEQAFVLPFPQKVAVYTGEDLVPYTKRSCFTFFGGANLMRREAMLSLGGLREPLKWHADWMLYLLLARKYPFAVVPEQFCCQRLAASQYSQSCHDWVQQAPVIDAILCTLKNQFPEEYVFFKRGALLPVYSPRVLPLLLMSKEHRDYLTPLLVWRLLSYRILRFARCLVPSNLRPALRRLFKV